MRSVKHIKTSLEMKTSKLHICRMELARLRSQCDEVQFAVFLHMVELESLKNELEDAENED